MDKEIVTQCTACGKLLTALQIGRKQTRCDEHSHAAQARKALKAEVLAELLAKQKTQIQQNQENLPNVDENLPDGVLQYAHVPAESHGTSPINYIDPNDERNPESPSALRRYAIARNLEDDPKTAAMLVGIQANAIQLAQLEANRTRYHNITDRTKLGNSVRASLALTVESLVSKIQHMNPTTLANATRTLCQALEMLGGVEGSYTAINLLYKKKVD